MKENRYIAGHSMGGVFAQLFNFDKKYEGLILMGSHLPNLPFIGNGKKSFDSRLLVLAAERDGYVPVTTVIRYYKEWEEKNQNRISIEKFYDYSVIILKAINHAQFASEKSMKRDFAPSIAYNDAQKSIKKAIISSLTLSNSKNSLHSITKMKSDTRELITPLRIANA